MIQEDLIVQRVLNVNRRFEVVVGVSTRIHTPSLESMAQKLSYIK